MCKGIVQLETVRVSTNKLIELFIPNELFEHATGVTMK